MCFNVPQEVITSAPLDSESEKLMTYCGTWVICSAGFLVLPLNTALSISETYTSYSLFLPCSIRTTPSSSAVGGLIITLEN